MARTLALRLTEMGSQWRFLSRVAKSLTFERIIGCSTQSKKLEVRKPVRKLLPFSDAFHSSLAFSAAFVAPKLSSRSFKLLKSLVDPLFLYMFYPYAPSR